MSTAKVAVVTGSNKGIGFAIVKGLLQTFDGLVYLTARDLGRGQKAVQALEQVGLRPNFHLLDIDDQSSIKAFRDFIQEKHGGIDILVNNAAIAFKVDATEPVSVQATETVKTNYFATLTVCEHLFPLLRGRASVVNVSSSAGHLMRLPSESLRSQLVSDTLTITRLSDLMKDYVQAATEGRHEKDGWGNSSYVVSKIGVSALTRIQQRLFDAENPLRDICVNSVHPGYVDTDMTSHKGPLTIEQGAEAPLFLALKAPSLRLKGQYVWFDKRIVDWTRFDSNGQLVEIKL